MAGPGEQKQAGQGRLVQSQWRGSGAAAGSRRGRAAASGRGAVVAMGGPRLFRMDEGTLFGKPTKKLRAATRANGSNKTLQLTSHFDRLHPRHPPKTPGQPLYTL